ncbi:MAG: fructose-1,6-bisphosphatase [Actinomycetota bacterium]|nr:fructose-1,6-bisphosphatase [Actinomycetota bacterium]
MPEAGSAQLTTLYGHTIDQQGRHPGAEPSGELPALIDAVAAALKVISEHLGRGPLPRAPGTPGEPEATGDPKRRLEMVCNEVMVAEAHRGGYLAALGPEGPGDLHPLPPPARQGRYLLVLDALEGSGNLDVDVPVGSIFSVLRSPSPDPGHAATAADFLRPGTEQVCAGFAVHGPATVLVLTTGSGVDGFTLDRDLGAFLLTHPRMQIPTETTELAIGRSDEGSWAAPLRRYVRECAEGASGPRAKDFEMRPATSLAADTYRILVRGGVLLHPAGREPSSEEGHLRLLQDANPIAFVVEQAGGSASSGARRVMELVPSALDERVPLVLGSRDEVERVAAYHRAAAGRADPFDSSLFNSRSLLRP